MPLSAPTARGGNRLRSPAQAVPHLARTQPWAPLVGAAAMGLLVVLTMSRFAGPFQRPSVLVAGLRTAFAATALGMAFLLRDPTDDLLEALPTPVRFLRATRLLIAVPAFVLAGAGQLALANHALAADQALQGLAHRPLAWPGLAIELAGFCGLTLLAAAMVGRGRWREHGGALAGPLGLGLIAALCLAPLGLTPTAYLLHPTHADHGAWRVAEAAWSAVAVLSAVLAGWASRDRWQRLARRNPANRNELSTAPTQLRGRRFRRRLSHAASPDQSPAPPRPEPGSAR